MKFERLTSYVCDDCGHKFRNMHNVISRCLKCNSANVGMTLKLMHPGQEHPILTKVNFKEFFVEKQEATTS